MNEVVLDYNLFDLPTAQHKAGLAGFLIMIESMKRRGLNTLPEILELSANRTTISVTKESLQAVFDDLFDAEIIEVKVKNKWQGKKPKRIDEVIVVREGKEKKEKRFVYDVLQPKGLFLQTFYPDADGCWLQIWRNMLWNILRAQPATRGVYEERASGHPSALSEKTYRLLVKAVKDRERGKKTSESFAGSVFIGAQDKNAEMVSFKGNPIDNLLLHFWHIASLVFIPRSFSIERSKEKATGIKWQDHGFALVIPEPSHIEYFFDDVLDLLQRLDTDLAGTRPRAALIDLAEESGLEYLYHLAKYRAHHQGVKDTVNAVEIHHIQKKGNNVRMLSAERLLPNIDILSKYERIRATRMNPIFKTLYLKNILQGNTWYYNGQHILTIYSAELLIYKTGKTPIKFPFFGSDAKKKFCNYSA
jgi:CRISPR-associated protein Cmx8